MEVLKKILGKILANLRFFVAIIGVSPLFLFIIFCLISPGSIDYSKFISLINSIFKYTEFINKQSNCKKDKRRSKKRSNQDKKRKK